MRKGDSVRILRGDYVGVEGKVTKVDYKKYRVFIEGVTKEKVDGSTVQVPIHPSKVALVKLNLDDKWRKSILEKAAPPTPVKEAAEPSKPAESKEA